MLPSSARSLRPREASSPSAHSLTPERCEAKTPGENTCPLVAFSITISTVLVPVPSAGTSYCAWAIDEMVKNATVAAMKPAKRIMLLPSFSWCTHVAGKNRCARRNARSAREVPKPCPLVRFVDALLLSLPPQLAIDFLFAPATDAGTDPSS